MIREILTFTCKNPDPLKSYTIKVVTDKNTILPKFSDITKMAKDPNAATKFPHCTESFETCPLFPKIKSEESFKEVLSYEILLGFLIQAILKSYQEGKSVDWRIKDAYAQCTRTLGQCEPAQTQYPLY